MNHILHYTDIEDKCYGLAGMAIGLFIYDGEQYLYSLSVDENQDEALKMAPEFYCCTNPEMSAKTVWNHLLRHFEIAAGMTISNVICRKMACHHDTVDTDTRNALFEAISQEGRDTCSLDDDEINTIFNKGYNYLTRIFNHNGVQKIASQLALQLKTQRTMSHNDINDILKILQTL